MKKLAALIFSLTLCPLLGMAQQSLPPATAPYYNFTTGFKLNGSYGTLGLCAISTGTGTQWGACAGGLPGVSSYNTNGIQTLGGSLNPFNDFVQQSSAPANPSAGNVRAWVDTSGNWYCKTSGGVLCNGNFAAVSAQQFTNAASPLTADAACAAGQYWLAPITGTTNAWRQCANGVLSNIGSGTGAITSPHSWTTYAALGDSITAGTGASVPANNYVSRMAAAVGAGYADNEGVGGSMACDVARNKSFSLYNPTDQGNALFTFMIGTNDANHGTSTYEPVSTLCRRAVETWLGTSSTHKYTGASFGTPPTNWSNDTTFAPNLTGIQSTTNGAPSTWPITTTGGPIFVWYRIIDGDGGTATCSTDSGTVLNIQGFTSPAIATLNGITNAVAMGMITGATGTNAAPVAHNVLCTVTSATNALNVVSILAVGTTGPSDAKNPSGVFVGGTPYELADANGTATAAYNADALSDVTTLAPLGVNLSFVDIRACLKGTSVEMFDTLHPNDLGHQHLFNCFYSAIQPTGGAPSNTSFPTVFFGSSTTYTPSMNDGALLMTSGTVSLPNTFSRPKVYFVGNLSSTATTSISSPGGGNANGIKIMPNGGDIFATLGNGTWWHIKNWSHVVHIITGTGSTAIGDEFVFQSGGGTLTFIGNNPDGTDMWVFNSDAANSLTLSGTITGFPLKNILPGQTCSFTAYGSTNWAFKGCGYSSFTPTLTGFGTSPAVTFNNGLDSIVLNVGTGGTSTSGTVTLPAAPHGWICIVNDVTTTSATVFMTKQTASTTTSVTIGNFNTSGAAAAWVASDVLNLSCKQF